MNNTMIIELTGSEKNRCEDLVNELVRKPEKIFTDFRTPWIRIVGEVGTPAFEEIPPVWLLADRHDEISNSGDRDEENLKLANQVSSRFGYSRRWAEINFDRGYWILDMDLAIRLLAAGVKGYGIAFIHDFDLGQVDYKLQELLLGRIRLW